MGYESINITGTNHGETTTGSYALIIGLIQRIMELESSDMIITKFNADIEFRKRNEGEIEKLSIKDAEMLESSLDDKIHFDKYLDRLCLSTLNVDEFYAFIRVFKENFEKAFHETLDIPTSIDAHKYINEILESRSLKYRISRMSPIIGKPYYVIYKESDGIQ